MNRQAFESRHIFFSPAFTAEMQGRHFGAAMPVAGREGLAAADAVAPWFERRVLDGLRFLLALPLHGTPSNGMFGATATAWVDQLWRAGIDWNERADNARLYQGFMALAAQSFRWPSPAMLLQCLRPRQSVLAN